jgi:uncharacterized membrane protein YbhN (UPF0104 family)
VLSLASLLRRAPAWLVGVVGLGAAVLAAAVVSRTVDTEALRRAADAAIADPEGIALAGGALLGAFLLRAVAWRRVLPALPTGHALAGIHLAMGANHVLPFRMGEPLRVASVVRRAHVPVDSATASTITLRTADILTLVALGAAASPVAFTRLLGWWGWAIVAVVAVVAALGTRWLLTLARAGRVRRPGVAVLALTASAWLLESVVIWRAASWVGIDLSPLDALLVTAAAVSAQIAAVAPSGFGTYEAAAVAAFGTLGHDAGVALAAALAAHALKTAYSLVAGAVALGHPAPTMIGRLRLPEPARRPARPTPVAVAPDAPIVLFLPAHDEEASVAAVVRRAPSSVAGHPVVVVVIDDGSVDATAAKAAGAGASVLSSPRNEGLGAAVRRGLRHGADDLHAAAVVFCDADGEYAPEELDRMVQPVLDGTADYVVGSRFAGRIDHMRTHRRVGNIVLTRALRFCARAPITDGQSGYRALSPGAARDAEVVHDYNYAQVLTLDLLAKGYVYAEVPISYQFRSTGRSFVRLGRYLRRVVPAVYREVNGAAVVNRVHAAVQSSTTNVANR